MKLTKVVDALCVSPCKTGTETLIRDPLFSLLKNLFIARFNLSLI